VTGISTVVAKTPYELSGELFHVSDLRSSNEILYNISNGVIPSIDDPRLATAKAEALQRVHAGRQAEPEKLQRKRFWIVVILAAFFLSPLGLLFSRKLNSTNRNQYKE
jgi:hypothetical protein